MNIINRKKFYNSTEISKMLDQQISSNFKVIQVKLLNL